ncbi:DUF389 domain-containing protein [Patescibacteria group bacterium]
MKFRLAKAEYDKAYQYLVNHSKFDISFIVLTALSAVLCWLGFAMDSEAVIIGAMVVAPLLYPVVALSASALQKNKDIFLRRIFVLFIGFFLVLGISSLLSIIHPLDLTNSNVALHMVTSGVIYFAVAFFAGMAGTFCLFWPKIMQGLVGVAIAVTLLPPLVLLGITFSTTGKLAGQTGTIVILNILGIILGSFTILVLFKIFRKKTDASD